MLTDEYLDYATNDVQVTWECFERLRDRYDGYGLTQTSVDRIYSRRASARPACARWASGRGEELQPDLPAELLGSILSTYYGGRAEVHLRRLVSRVPAATHAPASPPSPAAAPRPPTTRGWKPA